MKRIFWSRRRGPRPGHSSTSPWAACLGFGCAGGESQAVPRYLTGYCAVGQLHRAASVGAVATVERFLTFRVNGVNDPDKRNRTALHYACAHGHLGVVTLLIERNCNINACDDDNCTPLIKASQHQHGDCVAALLQHGADPNTVDALGNTALHYAVHSGNTFIASQLLEHSADIEAKTKEGFTPLSLALRQNKDLIGELLIEKGANIHTVFHPDRFSCRFGPDGPSRKTDSNIDTKDEVALKTSTPRQKASKARKTNLPPDHLQKTSQEKRKCGAGHIRAPSGGVPTKTAQEAQQSEQLNKVLRSKLRTFREPFEKEPPPRISKAEAHLKVEEERKYGLQEPNVALENSNDRTACTVASASAAVAAVSASTSAESASTAASAASNIVSAAFASASAASTSASVAFASASAASSSAASASASAFASDASAAAAAASASASDASAAAAAASAAAASAVASSNATVNAVVAAAVTAAFAAVTATADHKGSEPTPQRHSGATNHKDFALKAKEEYDK